MEYDSINNYFIDNHIEGGEALTPTKTAWAARNRNDKNKHPPAPPPRTSVQTIDGSGDPGGPARGHTRSFLRREVSVRFPRPRLHRPPASRISYGIE